MRANEREREITLSAPNGNDKIAYMVSAFYVSEHAFATKPPDRILTDAIDGAVKNASGRLQSTRDVTLQGFPGKEFVIEGEGYIARCRIYLVGERMYLPKVIGHAYSSLPMEPEAFHSAFKLIDPPK